MKKTQEVRIIARITIKKTGQVLYQVRSRTDASKAYCVVMLDSHSIQCDCPARKPCVHMAACTQREAARNRPTKQQPQLQPQESLAEVLFEKKVQGQKQIANDIAVITQQVTAMLAETSDDSWQSDDEMPAQEDEQTEAPQTVEKAPTSYGWSIASSPLANAAQIAEVAKKEDRMLARSSAERNLSASFLMRGQRAGGQLAACR